VLQLLISWRKVSEGRPCERGIGFHFRVGDKKNCVIEIMTGRHIDLKGLKVQDESVAHQGSASGFP
jgi:hypothetical protein